MPKQRLTEKQLRFISEYLLDLNATQAYIRAGYRARGNSAEANGNRLLRNDQVRAVVDAALKERSERTQITVDAVLAELEPLAHSCIDHYLVDDDGNVQLAHGAPANAMRAVRSLKKRVFFDKKGVVTGRMVELTLWDKPKSLDLEGSHLGMWKERLELTNPAPLFALAEGDRPDVFGIPTRD